MKRYVGPRCVVDEFSFCQLQVFLESRHDIEVRSVSRRCCLVRVVSKGGTNPMVLVASDGETLGISLLEEIDSPTTLRETQMEGLCVAPLPDTLSSWQLLWNLEITLQNFLRRVGASRSSDTRFPLPCDTVQKYPKVLEELCSLALCPACVGGENPISPGSFSLAELVSSETGRIQVCCHEKEEMHDSFDFPWPSSC